MRVFWGMREVCRVIGNGDVRAGRDLLAKLADRMIEARIKHPDWAGKGKYWGLAAVEGEMAEFRQAVLSESKERQVSEGLDLITTTVRHILDEHEPTEGYR